MKLKKLIAISSLALLFVFASCEKNESGTPTVQLRFDTVISETNLKSATPNSIEFTSGEIILENIEFETESENDSIEVEFEIDSYITIDFATGNITPDLSAVEIVPGNYSEIEIEFELWDQTEQPSIDLSGTWTDANGEIHPIRLLLPLGQTFGLEIEGDYTIHENTDMIAYITIDPGSWFIGEAGNLLSSATFNDEGIIIVSPDQNANIYDILKDTIDEISEVEIEL